ncbi:hypothetical protein CHS0354_003702 [Potamilus streckersoni]|uniref:Uncharacterized protein n=1 Tax=Potamilus streckersoni TaxID=2493646 RepID=A0AAE0SSK5_9BIVA|nr:hypothetical protein CHS0354_003702 [Potamilus streckersoni]
METLNDIINAKKANLKCFVFLEQTKHKDVIFEARYRGKSFIASKTDPYSDAARRAFGSPLDMYTTHCLIATAVEAMNDAGICVRHCDESHFETLRSIN